MPLLNTASKVYAGNVLAQKVYLGNTLVWSAAPPEWGPQERMLTDAEAQNYTGPGNYNLGSRFTVTAPGKITHIRYWHTGGCAVGTIHTASIWTNDRVQRVTVTDSNTGPGASAWHQLALPEPFQVFAGATYTVAVTTDTSWYAYSPAVTSIAPHLINLEGMYSAGTAFPETPAGVQYHVDVVYQEDLRPLPLTIPGLRFWLDATTLTDGPVSEWLSLAPGGLKAVQTTTAKKPAALTVDGRKAVKFTQSAAMCLDVAGLGNVLIGKPGYTIFVRHWTEWQTGYPVVMAAPMSGSTWQFVLQYNQSAYVINWGHPNLAYRAYGALPPLKTWWTMTALVRPEAHMYCNGVETTTYSLGVNGEPVVPVPPTVGPDIRIGASSSGGAGMQGYMTDILVYDRALSDSERQVVEGYLAE